LAESSLAQVEVTAPVLYAMVLDGVMPFGMRRPLWRPLLVPKNSD
jgi:hypothetical protein